MKERNIACSGTGINRIMKSYETRAKKPVIETTGSAFKIVLPNRNERSVKQEAENELEKWVLETVKKQGSVMRKDVEEAAGLGQTSAGRLLKKMLERGLLVQKGQGKNTRYTLPE